MIFRRSISDHSSFMNYSCGSDYISNKYFQFKQNIDLSNKKAAFYKAELDRTFEKANNQTSEIFTPNTNLNIYKLKFQTHSSKPLNNSSLSNQNEHNSKSQHKFYKSKFSSTEFELCDMAQSQIIQSHGNNQKMKNNLNRSLKQNEQITKRRNVKNQITQTNILDNHNQNELINKKKSNSDKICNKRNENIKNKSFSSHQLTQKNRFEVKTTNQALTKKKSTDFDVENIHSTNQNSEIQIQELKTLFSVLEQKFEKLQKEVGFQNQIIS